ncbi:GDSL-type esterase/lipase family protein [Paenibacillus sp.]|uniref:SGNH/GDSL hydrolase family protein n=1 Tax=Paenibacillus sp. TaxID=58172 RepID=UPI0028B16141|nr:GDSL-type esterase/lipase family protein [Paenibacillus sp.]
MVRDNTARLAARKALLAKGKGGPSAPILQAIASRGSNYSNGLSNGLTELAMSYKVSHLAAVDATDIALAYGNYYDEGWTNANPITVKVALLIRGIYYPVFFNGATSVTIGEGGTVVSDSTGIFLKKGETFYSITYVTVSAGQKYPRGMVVYQERGEGAVAADITASGSPTTYGVYAYHPLAVLGRAKTPTPAVLLVGDSIMQGANDGFQDVGFAARALDAAGIPWIRIAKGGGSIYNLTNRGAMQRMRLAKYCTHAITNYGINDLVGRTYTQMVADYQTLWSMLAEYGLKVFQCTITPHTDTTDNWATAVNQTFNPSTAAVGPASHRTNVNNYIRTSPAPLAGYFDVADKVETSRNSGLWKYPAKTDDGLHPRDNGHVDMAAAITTSLITV